MSPRRGRSAYRYHWRRIGWRDARASLAESWRGRDLGSGPEGLQLVLGFNTSAGEQVASWAPGAFVFKTLNTTGAGNMAKARGFPVKPVMPVAGDDAARKATVMELVGKLGFEPGDAGPLKNARLLEPLAMFWIDQAMKRGRGREFAFALVGRR